MLHGDVGKVVLVLLHVVRGSLVGQAGPSTPHGVDRGLDPGEPNTANLYTLSLEEVEARGIVSLPPTLLHAADHLVADDVLRGALGNGRDGDYVDYFAQTKRDEFRTITDQVTPAELEAYLSLF